MTVHGASAKRDDVSKSKSLETALKLIEPMTSYICGISVFALGMAMSLFGDAQVIRRSLRTWPIAIAYVMTTLGLLLLGAAWMVVAVG